VGSAVEKSHGCAERSVLIARRDLARCVCGTTHEAVMV
jgi:hypothetical protein